MFRNLAGFCIGATASGIFVLRMDDIIYTQMRRHIIHPIQILALRSRETDELAKSKGLQNGIGIDDIKQIGYGAGAFLK
jgi:hypothetical protein